jgi:dTDP-4-amino-4,6-dideoxygalactose transaminase
LQAAIGLAQFARLDEVIERKRAIRKAYYRRLGDCPGVRLPKDNGYGKVVPFRANILVDNPEGLQEYLKRREIFTRRFFYPLHQQPSFNPENSIIRRRPEVSQKLFDSGLMLPSSLALTEEQIDRVCTAIYEFQTTVSEPVPFAASPLRNLIPSVTI